MNDDKVSQPPKAQIAISKGANREAADDMAAALSRILGFAVPVTDLPDTPPKKPDADK